MSYSARIAIADKLSRENTISGTRTALSVLPGNAEYWEDLAAFEPGNASKLLRRALVLNPWDAEARMQLASLAEAEGRIGDAEALFLDAANHDKTFVPRWTLANFYFRRRMTTEFWRWAKEAAAESYEDLGPLLELAWRMTPDADEIQRRVLPGDCATDEQFIKFLMQHGHVSDATPVLTRLANCSGDGIDRTLLSYTSDLLLGGQTNEAIAVWRDLSLKRRIPYAGLAPEKGQSLTNGDFAFPFLREGFDWRFDSVPGVTISGRPSQSLVELSFNGMEPDACATLYQILPLLPERRYKLEFAVLAMPATSESGLHWRLADVHTGKPLTQDSDDIGLPGVATRTWSFRSPREAGAPMLVLVYLRPRGQVRLEGAVEIAHLKLGFASDLDR